MGRGQPDWGEYAPQEQVSKTLDLAELAARLGSPVIFDRNGTALFIDTFVNDLIHWFVSAQPECTISACTTKALFGGKSLQFAFSGVSSDDSYIQIRPPFLYINRVGIEITPMWDGADIVLGIGLHFYYQNKGYKFQAQYTPALQQLEVMTSSGMVIVTNDLPIWTSGDTWNVFKLIVDVPNARYVCLKVNNQIIDLSAYIPNIFSSLNPDWLSTLIWAHNTENYAENLYIGSVILTINEP
jgi:hypothetical protein